MCEADREVDTECDLVGVLSKKAADAAEEAERAATEAEQAVIQLCKGRNGYRRLAATCEAENDLNHGLRHLHNSVGSIAAATSALSCGTGDRMGNEKTYLDVVLQMLGCVT